MNAPALRLVVPFREVRHFQPDDCLHCEEIGVRARQHGWSIPVHAHEALFQFKFLEQGAMVADIDGLSYHLNAPAACMISPGVLHGFKFQPGSSGQIVTIPADMMDRGLATAPYRDCPFSDPVVVDASNIGPQLDQLASLFSNLASEFGTHRPRRGEALLAHASLLRIWFMRHGSSDPPSARRIDQGNLVRRFRSLLEQHYRDHWTLRDYAAALAITPDHLSRRCRIVSGQSALELVRDRMLLEARRLLAYTTRLVTEVGRCLGYDDPAYFSRFFAKHAGQSPSAYRESASDGRAPLPPASSVTDTGWPVA